MGNKQTRSPEFEQAMKQFSESALQDLTREFRSMAAQSRSEGHYVIASVFQAYYGIHGSLGARLFDIITRHRQDKFLSFEDLVLAKAKFVMGSPMEREDFAWALMDLLNDGRVTRTNVEAVVLSVLETALGPEVTIEEDSLRSFVNAVQFSEQGRDDRHLAAEAGEQREGQGAEECMTREAFSSWCRAVPSMRRVLTSLLTVPGAAKGGVPQLLVPEELANRTLLRSEYAWHVGGMLQEKDLHQWLLLYHSAVHGHSFNTFIGRISGISGPTILVVRDKGGAVFGGFASQPWERHSEFYGDHKSFIFTLSPKTVTYRTSGANTNIQWCAFNFVSESIPNGIGFGGQIGHFGLFLDSGFDHGHSRASVTFNSPSVSSSPSFVPDVIECWTVLSSADGEEGDKASTKALTGTILERFQEDRAVLNMVGIANASENTG